MPASCLRAFSAILQGVFSIILILTFSLMKHVSASSVCFVLIGLWWWGHICSSGVSPSGFAPFGFVRLFCLAIHSLKSSGIIAMRNFFCLDTRFICNWRKTSFWVFFTVQMMSEIFLQPALYSVSILLFIFLFGYAKAIRIASCLFSLGICYQTSAV